MAFGLELIKVEWIMEGRDWNARISMLWFREEYTQVPHFNVNAKAKPLHLAFLMESGNAWIMKNFAKVKVGIQTSSKFIVHYSKPYALTFFFCFLTDSFRLLIKFTLIPKTDSNLNSLYSIKCMIKQTGKKFNNFAWKWCWYNETI